MPTRRGSIQLGGAAAPVEDSAMRAVDVGAAVEGRDSFGEEDDDEVPVKVLASDFDSAAMAPPPPRAPAPAREESLQVFCRLRPLARGEQGGVVDVMDPHTIRSAPPAATQRHASHHVRREARDYTFARVFDAAATQNEVYERTTAPLVDGLFGGRSALLFTYGVTNAGKSYTMMGSPEDNDTAGLLPRSLGAILARAEDQRCEVRLSFLEIYNEHVYDLMAPTGRWAKRRALRVKDVTTRIEVANLTSTRVTSAAHGLELCRAAQSQRKTSKTGLNQTSSRSHAICSLEVRNAAGASTQLMLVDLAGSERGDRTGAAVGGARQKEANHINQSISRLMNCLRVVREKQHQHPSSSLCVPWRESKLTHLFQYLLQPPNDGQIARVSMVVCASPAAADHSETTYVVGNAAQAKAVAIVAPPQNQQRAAPTRNQNYDRNGRRVVEGQQTQPIPKKRKVPGGARPSQESLADTASTTSDLESEVTALKAALTAAHERISEVEREVRAECAEEMAATIQRIQQDYARRARHSSVAGPPPAPMDVETQPAQRDLCKSARKAQDRDRLEAYVLDSEAQFQEAEEELERVRAAKDAEITSLQAQHGDGVPRAEYDAVCHRLEQLERDAAARQAARAEAEAQKLREAVRAAEAAQEARIQEAERRAAADADRARQALEEASSARAAADSCKAKSDRDAALLEEATRRAEAAEAAVKHAEAMVQRQRESLPPPPPPIYADAGPVVPPAAGPFSPAKSPKKSPKRKSPAKSPAKEKGGVSPRARAPSIGRSVMARAGPDAEADQGAGRRGAVARRARAQDQGRAHRAREGAARRRADWRRPSPSEAREATSSEAALRPGSSAFPPPV